MNNEQNPLIEKYGAEKRWVVWKLMNRHGKATKVPLQTNGVLASSTNPDHWGTYAECRGKAETVGIVFTADQTLLGIDIDHCIINNKIEHEQKEQIADLILEADTYTEVSPSGTGLHLFLQLESSVSLISNRSTSFEIYTAGRYFTFTGNSYGTARPVRKVTEVDLLKVLSTIGYPWGKEKQEVVEREKISEELGQNKSGEQTGGLSDDDALLEKVFASKNGAKVKALYETHSKEDGKDTSTLDAQLLSHLAFWTGRRASQMERLWLNSPLGSRQKTQKRADYRARTIAFSISRCDEVYNPSTTIPEAKSERYDLDLLYVTNEKKEKVFIQNTENMCRILRKHPNFAGKLRYDEFKNSFEIYSYNSPIWRSIENNDDVEIQTAIQVLFPCFIKVGKDIVHDAIIKVSRENTFDSAADYMKSLVWDKTARIDDWLHNVYGVVKDKYHTAVASNWLKGLVKRVIEPGCQCDYVLVLEGPQGTKKSTSLSVLGGPQHWHVETTMGADNKDFFMQFAGKLIIEFSEGESLTRTEVKRLKAVITTKIDRYRTPYERVTQDFPRRCVFAMTTNQDEYLKDETGNRRWLPITLALEEANVKWLEENRDQLFAEAYHRVAVLKEPIYEFPKEETKREQAKRMIKDPNTENVMFWYYNKLTDVDRARGITVFQGYRDGYSGGYPSKPLDRYHEMIIGEIYRSSLYLTKRRKMTDAVQEMRWFDDLHVAKVDTSMDPKNTADTITADEIDNAAAWEH